MTATLKRIASSNFAQIQARNLLDFLQPVYQSVSMDVELARRLRNIEVVLKKRLIVSSVSSSSASMGFFLERFGQEHLAQRCRQLINDAADAEVIIMNDRLLVFKHFADLDGDLRLLQRSASSRR